MYLNRDEYLLLSRSGRIPRPGRPGPGRLREQPPAELRRLAVEAGGAASLPGAATAGLRRLLRRRGDGRVRPGARARSPQRLSGYADRETYVELEFAVGFGVEEESWL